MKLQDNLFSRILLVILKIIAVCLIVFFAYKGIRFGLSSASDYTIGCIAVLLMVDGFILRGTIFKAVLLLFLLIGKMILNTIKFIIGGKQ